MNQRGVSKVLIITVIAGILIVGAGIGYWLGRGEEASPKEEPSDSQETNQNPQFDAPFVGDYFSFIPPTGWIQTHLPSTLVSYQNSREVQPKDSAAAKINFKSYFAVSFDKTSGQTLDEITKMVKKQLEGVAPAIKFLSTVDGTIGGQPAKLIEADLKMQDVNFKVIVAIAMKGDKYFNISNNTTAEKWPEYRDIFYNVLNSFEFKY
ncbi:MAG TPA: PsbP-related protein [Candidatus Portnoybacteria bacterium]|nr:PsbP-related protein [Candidatus Portnoybacteria bacterium]